MLRLLCTHAGWCCGTASIGGLRVAGRLGTASANTWGSTGALPGAARLSAPPLRATGGAHGCLTWAGRSIQPDADGAAQGLTQQLAVWDTAGLRQHLADSVQHWRPDRLLRQLQLRLHSCQITCEVRPVTQETCLFKSMSSCPSTHELSGSIDKVLQPHLWRDDTLIRLTLPMQSPQECLIW